jgi:hypothetical protein
MMARQKMLDPFEVVKIVDRMCEFYGVPKTPLGRFYAMSTGLQFGILKFNGLPSKQQGKPKGAFKPDKKLKDPKGTVRRRKLRAGQ